MCQTIYQIKGNVQSYNKMNANTLLSVIIWKYGQKYYDIPKNDICKLKFEKNRISYISARYKNDLNLIKCAVVISSKLLHGI